MLPQSNKPTYPSNKLSDFDDFLHVALGNGIYTFYMTRSFRN